MMTKTRETSKHEKQLGRTFVASNEAGNVLGTYYIEPSTSCFKAERSRRVTAKFTSTTFSRPSSNSLEVGQVNVTKATVSEASV